MNFEVETQQIQPETKKTVDKKRIVIIGVVILAVIIASSVLLYRRANASPVSTPEVITVSTLERIINSSELSTFSAVYNGIASVTNTKKPSEIDYYVSYKAKVNVGISFDDVAITVDNEAKTISITLPPIHITDITVDITSLDFIFLNKKANASTVTQEAFKACEEDVRKESEQQDAIYELAKQNAVNILTAMTKPIIEQLDAAYKLVIE